MTGTARGSSPLGSWSARHACVFTTAESAVNLVLGELDQTFAATHFAQRPFTIGEGVLRVYERGSIVSDTLLTATGLAAWTTRIGPLSVQGRILVWAGIAGPGCAQMIVSQVTGGPISRDVVAATDAAVAATQARGVTIDSPRWIRAVDLPESSPAHPRTAHRLALAQRG